MERAYSLLEIKTVDSGSRTITGIATTPSPDRMGDVVEPKGAQYTLPIPFLWQHNHEQPIGHVTRATVTDQGILVTVQISKIDEPGTLKNRLDEAWHAIKAGLVRGLSIGFRSIESEPLRNGNGRRFKLWDFLELSAVTVPANADCSIQTVKTADERVRASISSIAKAPAPRAAERSTPVRINDPISYSGAVEFVAFAKCLIAGKGSFTAAEDYAARNKRIPDRVAKTVGDPRVHMYLKSPQSTMTTSDLDAIAPYRQMVAGFIESLQQVSVFDRLLAGGMRVIPLRTRLSAVTSAVTGSIVGEGQPKPVSRFSLSDGTLEPKKAVAVIVLSDVVKRENVSGTDAFLATELKNGVSLVTDQAFLAGLLDDAPEIVSSGDDAAAVRRDIANLLAAVTLSARSRTYLVSSSELAKQIALLPDSAGGLAFPGMTPMGGEIAGIPFLVTDGLNTDSDGQHLGLIDASAVAGNSDTIGLDASEQATLELDSTPVADTTAVNISLWQNNLVALRAERWFGFEKLRESGFAIVRNANYGAGT